MEIEEKSLTVTEIRIKLLRDIKGLTQQDLAKKLHVSRSLINSWENGYIEISLPQIMKLSFFYQTPIDYILGLTTNFDRSIYDFQEKLDLNLFGKNIRIIRKVERLTQVEFAKKVNINSISLSHFENGNSMISCSNLKQICNTFGYSADWCVGNTKECIRRKKKICLSKDEINQFIAL